MVKKFDIIAIVCVVLGGCSYLPFDSRRWKFVKEETSIRWGKGEREDKIETSGFYLFDNLSIGERVRHDFLLFYKDGTFIEFLTDEDDFNLLAAQLNLESFLKVRGIWNGIWKYEGSGIYEIIGDTIRVEEQVGDFFFFQNLWRWLYKREFVIVDRTHLREIKYQVLSGGGRNREVRYTHEIEPMGSCQFYPARNIPPPSAKLKRHKWLWE